jgi:serine protease inhibitor ecotin
MDRSAFMVPELRLGAALVSPNGHMGLGRWPKFVNRIAASNPKGITMRIFTASVIIAALSFAAPVFAQAPATPSQPEAQAPAAESGTVIHSIQVVDIKKLKPEVRSKIDEIVAQTSEEDLQSLRKSIDATPEVASALKSKGLNSSQIVAINIADGVLTMFAKMA